MDDRAWLFVEVMGAIALVGVLAFLVSLAARPRAAADGPAAAPAGPQWYVYVLAILLLVAVAAALIWELSPSGESALARMRIADDERSLIFFIVMLAVGGIAVIAVLAYALARIPRPARGAETADGAQPAATEAATPVAASTGGNLLGLLVLALGFLLLNWIYVPAAHRYALMLHLVYPASIAVALVLLFDKATRAWSAHGAGTTLREWLFCDLIVFLLILGFLNLLESGAGDEYGAVLWDTVNVMLFFLVFWIVDRTGARLRFLVAHVYLIVLPLLLLIWRAVQGVELPEGLGWWSSIWPFFFLAIAFLALEIIALVASRDSDTRSALPTIKDFLFVAAYAVLLVVAVPGEG